MAPDYHRRRDSGSYASAPANVLSSRRMTSYWIRSHGINVCTWSHIATRNVSSGSRRQLRLTGAQQTRCGCPRRLQARCRPRNTSKFQNAHQQHEKGSRQQREFYCGHAVFFPTPSVEFCKHYQLPLNSLAPVLPPDAQAGAGLYGFVPSSIVCRPALKSR